MMRRGTSSGRVGRQCAGCGRIINSGLYCAQCLEKFRERAKVQGERMETLKTNARKRFVEGMGEVGILIANSDERNLGITKIVLERGLPDYKIFTAGNPLIAINILVTREVSLLILDADYNGLEMLRRVRDDERFQDVAVMMMSGSTERETVAEVFSLGVQDYVTKPCAPEDLTARIKKLLDPNAKAAVAAAAPVTAKTQADTRQKTTFRILLIDDDIFDLRQERTILQNRLPCQVTTAQSAAEGMRILENQGADLILVSLDMPFVNGLKFFSLVRNNTNVKVKNLPVLIMTTTRDFAVITEIERSGATGHLKKPNFTEDGLALIEDKLRKRR